MCCKNKPSLINLIYSGQLLFSSTLYHHSWGMPLTPVDQACTHLFNGVKTLQLITHWKVPHCWARGINKKYADSWCLKSQKLMSNIWGMPLTPLDQACTYLFEGVKTPYLITRWKVPHRWAWGINKKYSESLCLKSQKLMSNIYMHLFIRILICICSKV